MSRVEVQNDKRKEKLKELAARIVSIGISVIVVASATSAYINYDKKNMPDITKDNETVQIYVPRIRHLQEELINPSYPEDIQYFIQRNDTLGKICKKFDIDPNYYLMLAYYNNIKNPNIIFEDDVIKVPVEEKLLETAIAGINKGHPLLSEKYHHVKEGERLYNICQAKFGNGEYSYALAHWQQINPNNLEVNQIVYLLSKEELDVYIETNRQEIEEFRNYFLNEKVKQL